MVNRPYMIDIYQGDTVLGANDEGFAQVRAAGIAFLDHKASQGTEEIDSRCAFRRSKWMDGYIIPVTDVDGTLWQLQARFGFYHFNDAGDAAAQAAHFISAVKAAGYVAGDDLCLDWENIGASGFSQPVSWADTFCDAVEQWCGFPLKVYGGNVPREQMPRATSAEYARFTQRRFWFCEYGSFNPRMVPAAWADGPCYWQDDGDQYGPGPHRIAGLTGYCDNSTVVGNMTVAKVYNSWGGGSVKVAA